MISVDNAINIVDTIGKHAASPDHWQSLMREYFADGSGKTSGDVTIGEFLAGLSKAVHWSGLGLWLDIREASEITDRAGGIIETHIGIPEDPDWMPYQYSGDSIEEGLAGFDHWLLDNYLRNKNLTQLRLIEVTTGSDFFLSILHPDHQADALIEQLAQLGVTAHRQTTAREPLLEFDNFDEPADFAMHYLQVRLGYQRAANSERFLRWVDEQHGVILDLVASPTTDWECEAANAPDFVAPPALEVGVVRRDIADLKAMLEGSRIRDGRYKPTILEFSQSPFLDRPVDLPTVENELVPYLDAWIPRLDTIANLAFIEQHLEAGTVQFFGHQAALNRALNGNSTSEDHSTLTDAYPAYEDWAATQSTQPRELS